MDKSFLSDEELIKLYELLLTTSPVHPSHSTLHSIISREMEIRGQSIHKFYNDVKQGRKATDRQNVNENSKVLNKIDSDIIKKTAKKLNPNSIEQEFKKRIEQIKTLEEDFK